MNNQKITFSIAEINATSTGNQLMKACDIEGSTPQNIYFTNNCGKDIEINFISSGEKSEFLNDASTFTGILVSDGGTFNSKDIMKEDPARMIHYLLLAKVEAGDATAALDVYCIDYI